MASIPRAALVVCALVVGCQRLDGDALSTSIGGGTVGDDSGGGTVAGTIADEGSSSAETGNGEGPSMACNPVTQTGCNPGEKCTAVTASGSYDYQCVGDAADIGLYESCEQSAGSGVDGCAAGTTCIAPEDLGGQCMQLCLGNSDCDDALCVAAPVTHIPFCAPECSPFDAACPGATQCRPENDRFVCRFFDNSDTGQTAEPCTGRDGGCGEGFACFAGALVPDCTADSCCTPVCNTNDADTCASPTACTPMFAAPAPGAEFIGVCIVAT